MDFLTLSIKRRHWNRAVNSMGFRIRRLRFKSNFLPYQSLNVCIFEMEIIMRSWDS